MLYIIARPVWTVVMLKPDMNVTMLYYIARPVMTGSERRKCFLHQHQQKFNPQTFHYIKLASILHRKKLIPKISEHEKAVPNIHSRSLDPHTMASCDSSEDDLEVASVLSKGKYGFYRGCQSPGRSPRSLSSNKHSSPRCSSTILTNVHRGNTRTVSPKSNELPVQQIAARGDIQLLQYELDKVEGSTINQIDSNGFTPLMWTCMNGHTAAVSVLLERGANIDISPDVTSPSGFHPLLIACSEGHRMIVQHLLDYGASVNECEPENETSGLLYAVYGGHSAVVDLLLERGADVTHTNEDGLTALDLAYQMHNTQVQKALEGYILDVLENG
ncbi:unnamed protein product [Owenia fusiformis]|uniref:Uncharacterized protein n=1 Tax=Owenia fusiformis TaxID=6347 RepID=A0A8S4PPY0_OWEFU|nr:unnamed protein product [Owenia fusiformis]